MSDVGVETVATNGTTVFAGNTVYIRQGLFTGYQYSVDWNGYNDCTASGNVDHGSYVADVAGSVIVTTINDPQVLYLPTDPDDNVGYAWVSSYTQNVELNGTPQDFDVEWSWEVVGVESVAVPADTFDAVHVSAVYESEDQLGEHEGTLDTYWVEGIGLVKWDEWRPTETGQFILRELSSYSGELFPY